MQKISIHDEKKVKELLESKFYYRFWWNDYSFKANKRNTKRKLLF